jgi:tetratricopeptide (TPR) repeat protein
MPLTPLGPGSLLAGKYLLGGLLGRGGMGSVYEAVHVGVGKQVAVKVLEERFAHDPGLLKRFELEAQAAAVIGHPGIVDVLDVGRTDDGRAYMVMERLHGVTLRDLELVQRPMPVGQVVAVIAPALEALHAAHLKGVIHRDLKPGNLFLTVEGAVKLLDFGISKFSSQGEGMTQTGVVLGTVGYMAPEQLRSGRNVGPASDLYAMGAVLYALLAGRPPHKAEHDAETVAQILTVDPEPLQSRRPELPPALCALVDGLLVKDPELRPKVAGEVRAALLACAAPDLEGALYVARGILATQSAGPVVDDYASPSGIAATTPAALPTAPRAPPPPVAMTATPAPARKPRTAQTMAATAIGLFLVGIFSAGPLLEQWDEHRGRVTRGNERARKLGLREAEPLERDWAREYSSAVDAGQVATSNVLLDRARALNARGRGSEAMALLEALVDQTADGGAPGAQGHARRVRGNFHLDRDRCKAAEEDYRAAFTLFVQAGDHVGAGMVAQDLALMSNQCVGPDRVEWYTRAAEQRRLGHDVLGLFKSTNSLGMSYLLRASPRQAVPAFGEAIAAARELGDDSLLLKAQVNLVAAWVREARRAVPVAIRWEDAGVAASPEWASAQAALAEALLTAGRLGIPGARICERVAIEERAHCEQVLPDIPGN